MPIKPHTGADDGNGIGVLEDICVHPRSSAVPLIGQAMNKYGFRIRTRSGGLVENLQVHARDRAEAESKITQIYHHCEILECQEVTPTLKKEGLDLEDVISLINKQDKT